MSQDKVPDWVRMKAELQSQLKGVWSEIARLSDTIWRSERRAKDVDMRLLRLEEEYIELRREFNRSNTKPIRSDGRYEKF